MLPKLLYDYVLVVGMAARNSQLCYFPNVSPTYLIANHSHRKKMHRLGWNTIDFATRVSTSVSPEEHARFIWPKSRNRGSQSKRPRDIPRHQSCHPIRASARFTISICSGGCPNASGISRRIRLGRRPPLQGELTCIRMRRPRRSIWASQ